MPNPKEIWCTATSIIMLAAIIGLLGTAFGYAVVWRLMTPRNALFWLYLGLGHKLIKGIPIGIAM
jgi:hypothetical protein